MHTCDRNNGRQKLPENPHRSTAARDREEEGETVNKSDAARLGSKRLGIRATGDELEREEERGRRY
jgi:hypothetical protein